MDTLAQLKARETSVTTALNQLISSQKDLARELGKLDLMRAQLGSQSVATRAISANMLSDAASTAQRISGAVHRLDLEQARVGETLAVVEQVAELKACVLGVNGSMGAPQDWETAAGYLHRASKIPKDIIGGAFAEEIVPSAEVPDPPSVTLENAAESLCGLFLREFEKAAKEDDGAKVTRFFKLFPLIGRSQVGLDVYGRFVCQGVAAHARGNLNAGTGGVQRKEGFFYANALTKLFEYIVQIVERHGGLVERHYGQGRMVRVIERLQAEADTQGGIVIDTWSEERNIDRKLTDIKSYAFTFLVQSFMSTLPSKGIPRSGSPAAFDKTRRSIDEETIDMKEVDGFLNEMGVMLGRWSLYCRFLAAKCKETSEDEAMVLPPLLLHSNLYKKVADRLMTPFNLMTTFYFRRSVEKAFQLDEQPPDLSLNLNRPISSRAPYITSCVDDVMYIVNQVVQRALATSQGDVVVSVIPTIARVLSSDFVGMIQRKMRDESYPKPLVQGGFPAEQTIVAFLVLINNLDIATEYIKRIVQSHLESPTTSPDSSGDFLTSSFPFGNDATVVRNTLASLRDTLETKATELLKEGIYVVFKNVAKPRLRSILADTFRDADYSLTTESTTHGTTDLSSASPPSSPPLDAVPTRFRAAWDALARPLARLLTPATHARLLGLLLPALADALEKRIWACHGRIAGALGAARLERDVARIASAAVQGAPWATRDAFMRCAQLCTIMDMEEEEWEEVLAGLADGKAAEEGEVAAVDWKIDREEMVRARAMVKW